ncbi:hypothetical protein BJG93_35350 [Paraburkholderia sprentiae WSM5005]|uniref:Uncharacterized protein n=1 Tax=Paraburkholderia sprentiae WSM5005 TaxID=754502 RepID=A0A8F4KHD0_9BURK|nr:hypothetical protein [Paraburkholderia sprentiae]QXE07134.1 hypothetical protein BJG93_35350 [Paraburkholderia sprentiae WSM5005]
MKITQFFQYAEREADLVEAPLPARRGITVRRGMVIPGLVERSSRWPMDSEKESQRAGKLLQSRERADAVSRRALTRLSRDDDAPRLGD